MEATGRLSRPEVRRWLPLIYAGAVIVVGAILLMIVAATNASIIIQVLLNGLMGGLLLVLFSLGLALMFGIMHIINFAHGEIYMLGAYASWWLAAKSGLNWWLALVVSMVVVAFIGILIERFAFRPFRGQFIGVVVVGVAFILLLQQGSLLLFGTANRAINSPSVAAGIVKVMDAVISRERLLVMAFGVVFLAAVLYFLHRTRHGTALQAAGQDSDAAALQGVNLGFCCSLAMGIGCALAAGAGVLAGTLFYVNPYIGAPLLMKGGLAIILGGMGSITGCILAGLLIGFVESIGTTFLGYYVTAPLLYLLAIVILIFKPQGLFGHA